MSEATEAGVDTTQYDSQALALREQIAAIAPITSDAELQIVGSVFKDATANIKNLEEHMDGPIKDAHAKHKRLTELRNKLTAPFKQIKADADSKLTTYRREQQAKAAEEQRKADEEARKRAEDARLAEAEALALSGKREQAEAVLDAPIMPEPVAPPPPIATVEGVSSRRTYSAEVVDMRKLCAAIAEGKAQVEFVTANQTVINSMARALKNNFCVPGIKVVMKESTSARF